MSFKTVNFSNKHIYTYLQTFQNTCNIRSTFTEAGCHSSVGSDVAWESRGTAIDPRVRHIFSRRFGHENISTTILPLPLIQEEHLSVNGERMGAKYWLPAREACPGTVWIG